MIVTRLILKNWKNFREVNIPLRDQSYLLGPNASGKSNLLDVFRFLRDVSKPQGGGLQRAVEDRGGVSKIRCLHARRYSDVNIEIHLSENADDIKPDWKYFLSFKAEDKKTNRAIITGEEVWRLGKKSFSRPDAEDKKDPERLTQTNLENIQANREFRQIAEFFSRITYLHLVPQLLKFGEKIGGYRLEDDPFGQGFLERVAKATDKVRKSRLKKIEKALSYAVPQFENLRFEQEKITGQWHLEARYSHHRPNAGWQREDQFSDGTLRLIGVLWSLLESDSMLLLEEPEISLNDSIVRQIPIILHKAQKDRKSSRQILTSTHSESLLSNQGIDARGVILLSPSSDGTNARTVDKEESDIIKCGLSVAEVMLPKTRPVSVDQLSLL